MVFVVPAQAGTSANWIPACAGMTGKTLPNSESAEGLLHAAFKQIWYKIKMTPFLQGVTINSTLGVRLALFLGQQELHQSFNVGVAEARDEAAGHHPLDSSLHARRHEGLRISY